MSVVLVKLTISNPDNGVEPVVVDDAVVDTGSIHTVVTRELATRLNLPKTPSIEVLTAGGPARLEGSYAFLELQGKAMMTPVLVSDTLSHTIIGVTLLEWLGFIVDPGREELRDTDILLL